ncbi:PspA/IM30 family protein [Corynebacterium capitovis DSM 44611]|uniref:PspA/IM30 family protein n=1 Tax=Corynebacterium capitovis TaxID=131081 RepID=UPI00037F2A90|nr:PspA/IM30 family protein [Corynebacterium capitovis]WKD58336.1 PspA/IM30 family protein [Corynebacterium capitovis DSM 44611]
MANPLSKGWKYLMQSFDSKIDENADPKVQVQQAIAEAKKRHQEISQHAANIIGNRNQLQMKLDRLVGSQQDLQNKARTALQAADNASAAGETEKAQQHNNTAEVIASQLVSVEQELEQTKTAYAAAEQAADEAQRQQKQSEAKLQEQLNEVSKLESQIDQAKMQEQTAKSMDSVNQYNADDSVPTLEGVREKIERRYANALGAQELAQDSMTGRIAEIEATGTDVAASNRLAEIRASMQSGAGRELEAGDAEANPTEGAAEEAHPRDPQAPDAQTGTQKGE